jgi:hypothetical protein
MTPEEVRLVIRGWHDNQTQLALTANVFRFAVALRCRVTAVSDSWIELSTADNGRLAVDFSDPETIFRYTEPREFAELSARLGLSPAQRLASSLTALFPSEGDSSPVESVMLMELVDSGL